MCANLDPYGPVGHQDLAETACGFGGCFTASHLPFQKEFPLRRNHSDCTVRPHTPLGSADFIPSCVHTRGQSTRQVRARLMRLRRKISMSCPVVHSFHSRGSEEFRYALCAHPWITYQAGMRQAMRLYQCISYTYDLLVTQPYSLRLVALFVVCVAGLYSGSQLACDRCLFSQAWPGISGQQSLHFSLLDRPSLIGKSDSGAGGRGRQIGHIVRAATPR